MEEINIIKKKFRKLLLKFELIMKKYMCVMDQINIISTC